MLDVSFNRLPADALLGPSSPLALLPLLRQLDASGNGLGSLPRGGLGAFAALQTLRLTHNGLTGGALAPLAALPALVSLNLAHNAVAEAPAALLSVRASSSTAYASASAPAPASCGAISVAAVLSGGGQLAPTRESAATAGAPGASTDLLPPGGPDGGGGPAAVPLTSTELGGARPSGPFPRLRFLDLGHNRLASEQVTSWSLKWLVDCRGC